MYNTEYIEQHFLSKLLKASEENETIKMFLSEYKNPIFFENDKFSGLDNLNVAQFEEDDIEWETLADIEDPDNSLENE